MKRRSQHAEVHVPWTVVTYIGRVTGFAAVASAFLVWRVVELTSGSEVAADAAVIGLVTGITGFATGGIATLGAILASTRSTSDPPQEVVAPPGEPLAVEEVKP